MSYSSLGVVMVSFASSIDFNLFTAAKFIAISKVVVLIFEFKVKRKMLVRRDF